MFTQKFIAGWGDMDFNAHMKNTAYLDRAADVRMMYFSEQGFPMSEFMRMRLGPVVMKDEIEYFREIHLLESLAVTLSLAGLAEDGSRMAIRNEIFRDGKLAARITSMVGWMDLDRRKLVCPPDKLLQIIEQLSRSDDFKPLPGSARE